MGKAKDNFTSCCKCARDGFGGAVISHAGCLVTPFIAAGLGTSVSAGFMMASMFITSPLIAMGATYGLDWLRGQRSSPLKLAGSAAAALVIAFGIHSVFGHGGHEHHENHDHHEHHQHGKMTLPADRETLLAIGQLCVSP